MVRDKIGNRIKDKGYRIERWNKFHLLLKCKLNIQFDSFLGDDHINIHFLI